MLEFESKRQDQTPQHQEKLSKNETVQPAILVQSVFLGISAAFQYRIVPALREPVALFI